MVRLYPRACKIAFVEMGKRKNENFNILLEQCCTINYSFDKITAKNKQQSKTNSTPDHDKNLVLTLNQVHLQLIR